MHTMETAIAEAQCYATQTGESWAVCDDEEGRLFVVAADQYSDQQLIVVKPA